MEKYSQNDEQSHILKFFEGKTGRFLDCGAYNGHTFSNSRALSLLGWSGVLVEPSPQCFVGLMLEYEGRNDCQLVNLAVGGGAGRIVRFHDSGGACATTIDSNYEKWAPYQKDFRDIFVASVPVKSLIGTFPGPYEFISIDCEGVDWDILQELDLDALKTKMICIEFGNFYKEIWERLQPMGFEIVYQNAENILAQRL